jgi:hypothetical protein
MNAPPDYLIEYSKRLPLERQAPFIRDWMYFHGTLDPNDELLKVMDLLLDLGLGNRVTFETQNECALILRELIRVADSREHGLQAWAARTLEELTTVAGQVRQSAAEAAKSAKAAADEKLPWNKIVWTLLFFAAVMSSGVIAGDALLLSRVPATNRSAAEYEAELNRLGDTLNAYQSAYSKEQNINADLTLRLKKLETGTPPVEGGFESQRRDYPQQYP